MPTSAEEITTDPRQDALDPGGMLIDDDVDPAAFESSQESEELSLDAGESTQFGVAPLPDLDGNARLDEALAAAEAAGDADEDFGFDADGIEEIDDFEILAEADIEAIVEADVGPQGARDFVAQLELSNEHQAVADPLAGFRERDSAVSIGDPSYEEPRYDETFTVPGELPDPLAGFAEEEAFGHSYARPTPVAHVPSPIEGDLEQALEALDVDLDELGGAPVATKLLPMTPYARNRPPRAGSEDGVLIDFDDDD